jgi:N-acyl-D-aspartate/D-glutamate deacylase
MGATLFTNVRVFDGSGADSFQGEVLVQGNRIRKVAKGTGQIAREEAGRTVDGQGMTLMPGMVEGHCHPSFSSA